MKIGRIEFGHKETAAEMQERTLKELADLTRDSRHLDAVGQRLDVQPDSPARIENCIRCSELEAARDHLRARLRQLNWYVQHRSHCDALSWTYRADLTGSPLISVPSGKGCTCGLADLLAVLTEPPQEENDEKIKENVTRSAETDVIREVPLPHRED